MEAGQATLLFLHPTTRVAAGQRLVADIGRSFLALRVRTDTADGQQASVADSATETTRALATTCGIEESVYGCMGVWIHGCMGVWVYGHMGVWEYWYQQWYI